MTCSTSYCLYDTLMDQWNVCMYINSIIYAITTYKFSFYPFQTFTTHCHWFCFRCGCLCSVFLALFSWYAADSYLAIIIWSAALKRFELICYYLIPFHDFSIFNNFFYGYGKNNWWQTAALSCPLLMCIGSDIFLSYSSIFIVFLYVVDG
jgi:hypothetical protein